MSVSATPPPFLTSRDGAGLGGGRGQPGNGLGWTPTYQCQVQVQVHVEASSVPSGCTCVLQLGAEHVLHEFRLG